MHLCSYSLTGVMHTLGLNGDGIGTANEIGRITALIVIAVTLKLSLNGYLGGLEWTLL